MAKTYGLYQSKSLGEKYREKQINLMMMATSLKNKLRLRSEKGFFAQHQHVPEKEQGKENIFSDLIYCVFIATMGFFDGSNH